MISRLFFLILLICTYGSSYAQKYSDDKIFEYYLNDRKVIDFFRLDRNAIDTLKIIDCNYFLSKEPFVQNDSIHTVKLLRRTTLSLDIINMVNNPKKFTEEAKRWQNTIWVKAIQRCKKRIIISCYSGQFNKGGSVIYRIKKGKIRADYSDLGTW